MVSGTIITPEQFKSPNDPDDTASLQAALDAAEYAATHAMGNSYVVVQLEPRSYSISAPLEFGRQPGTWFAKVLLQGYPRHITRIQQTNQALDVFQLNVGSGATMAEFMIDGVTFADGARGLVGSNLQYCRFNECGFRGQDVHAIDIDGTTLQTTFTNPWAFHVQGNMLKLSSSAVLEIYGATFGEDIGGFEVAGAHLRIYNSQIFGCRDNLGINKLGEGNVVFRLQAGALTLSNVRLDPASGVDAVIYHDLAREVMISGLNYRGQAPVFMLGRGYWGAVPYSPVSVDGMFFVEGAGTWTPYRQMGGAVSSCPAGMYWRGHVRLSDNDSAGWEIIPPGLKDELTFMTPSGVL